MGETYIYINVRPIRQVLGHSGGIIELGERSEGLRLLVDTGSTYSWVPRKVLEGLGVRPSGKRAFTLMSGERVEREIGDVFVEWGGEVGTTKVVFSEEGEGSVFGLHGMESLGLEVDPLKNEVRRSESLLALRVQVLVSGCS